MEPDKLKIKEITASEPKLIEKGSNKFCLIPLKDEDDKPIQLKFDTKKFKIYEHQSKAFSLGINLRDAYLCDRDDVHTMIELEKKIKELAMEKKSQVKKVNHFFSNFTKR